MSEDSPDGSISSPDGTIVAFNKKSSFALYGDEEAAVPFHLPPIPSMGKFKEDRWEKHPLLSYYGNVLKREVDDSIIVKRGRATKTRVCDKIWKEKRRKLNEAEEDEEIPEDFDSFLNQDDYVEFLRDSVRSAPVNPLHKKWRKKILGVRIRCLI